MEMDTAGRLACRLAGFMLLVACSFPAMPAEHASLRDNGELTFHRLPLNNALTQNTVVSMLQDRRGLMWFGTLGGLDVYDGYEFRTISSDPRDENALSGVHVSRLYEDRAGNIWVAGFRGWLDRIEPGSRHIHHYAPELYGDPGNLTPGPTAFHETPRGELLIGTATGLHRYDPERDEFIRNVDKLDDGQEFGAILDIAGDGSGRLWIATTSGLYRYDPASREREHFVHQPDDPASLPGNTVVRLVFDSRQRLWIGTAANGLARMDPGEEGFRRFRADADDPRSIASDQVVDVMEDRKGRIWVANQSGGLSLHVSDEAGFDVFRHDPDDPASISANDVWSLLEDRSGLIWIGTAGSGLNQVNPSRSRFKTLKSIPHNDNSLNSSFVWDLVEGPDGRIWMATLAGLESYSPARREFGFFPPRPGSVTENQLQSIAADGNGRIWAGTVDGSLFLFDPVSESFTEIFREGAPAGAFDRGRIWQLHADDAGRVWVAGTTGLYAVSIDTLEIVSELPASDAIPMGGNPVRVMLPAEDGAFWLGGGGVGLAKFMPGEGIVQSFRSERDNPESLSHKVVRSLYMDEDGGLWIGTLNGLNYLAKSDREAGRNRVTLYTVADGLPNNTVYGIEPEVDGRLWLTTNEGISRFDVASGRFENFDVADGLPSNEMNGGAELRASDGRLYFGGVDGVTIVDPDRLQRNDTVPGIAITAFSIHGKQMPVDAENVIELPYGSNDITIEFAVTDFHQPEKNSFRYRLLGASGDWRPTDARRISLNRLVPGDYRFEVRGSNNDGVWSDEAAGIAFRILPPLWRSPAAYSLYAMLLLLALLAYHQMQRRRLARERDFNEQIRQAHSLAEANHQMALRYAQSDQLTQLPNRSSLMDALARYMRLAGSSRRQLAVVLVNLDRFQQVNDSFGHAIGDRVLKTIAARLEKMTGEDDFLARVGSDEFAWLVLVDAGGNVDEWAREQAECINRAIGEPFDFQDPPVIIQASVGCAIYRGGSESASDLLGYADVALHAAKHDEEPRVRCYEPAMSESARQRMTIEARMKRALETDEFSAHYQPLVAIPGGELKALEALIRWQPVDGDPIFPDQFIPVAEQSGLIVDVGNWMIRHVCRQLQEWKDFEPADYQVAINVSMRQLRSGTLVPTLRDALSQTGVSPAALKVEITESAMMENVEDTAEQLLEVNRLGVEISVDDFGTGFSSLSHLKMLPVHELKIDRSFVMDIASSEESRTIVMSIVRLAHELKLRVVAEGVEDETALQILTEMGCDLAQGYFFSRPLPPLELVKAGWLHATRGRSKAPA